MVPKPRSHSIAFVHKASFSKTFNFNFRRDHQKNFLWASLSYEHRDYESVDEFTNLFKPFPPSVPRLEKHLILILEGILKKISY